MANTQYFGRRTGFYYVPSSGTTWETFLLPTQFLEIRPSYRIRQYVANSLDFSAREVFNVVGPNSTGHHEVVFTVRFVNDSTHTIQFLRTAAQGRHFRWTSSLTTGTTDGDMGNGTDFVIADLSPGGFDTLMDRARGSGSYEDLEFTMRLRGATTEAAGVVKSSATPRMW